MRKYMADSTGNCLQCCLAGLFDVPLERVPPAVDWKETPSGWFSAMYDWVLEYTGYVTVAVLDDTLDDLLHIEIVENLEGIHHAFIARGMTVIHNPDSSTPIDLDRDTQYKLLFVPLTGIQRRTPVEEMRDDTE